MIEINSKFKVLFSAISILLIFYSLGLTQERFKDDKKSLEQKAYSLESLAQKSSLGWNRISLHNSIKYYKDAIEIWKKVNNKKKQSFCLKKLGKLYILFGKTETALKYLNNSLKILGNSNFAAEESEVYSELSLLHLYSGQINEGERELKKALFLADQSGNLKAKAKAFYAEGEYYYARSHLDKSLKSFEESINFWEKTDEIQEEAQTKLSLSYLYLKQNHYSKGLETLHSSLSKLEKIKDQRGLALNYKAIGKFYSNIQENQKALDFYRKSESMFAKDLDYAEQASLFNGIALIYENYGEFKIALDYRIKAFELFERENHLYGQVATLPDLARLSYINGNYSLAKNSLIKGNDLANKLSDKFYLALNNEQLGNLYFQNGELKKSILYFNKSLEFFKKKSQTRQISRVFKNKGLVYQKLNNFLLSRKYLSESLKLNQMVLDKFAEAEILHSLAEIEILEGKILNALKYSKKSFELTETLYSDVGNNQLRKIYLSNVFDRYELYIHLLINMHKRFPDKNYNLQALQISEKSRSRSMLESLHLAESNFTADADPETVKREEAIQNLLNIKADKLTQSLGNNAPKDEVKILEYEINELKNELGEIKGNLKQKSPVYSAIKNPTDFNVKEFQNDVLDKNTLLLEFSLGKKESYLWLIGKNEFDTFILPKREILETRIEKLRQLLITREMLPDEDIADFQTRVAQAEKEYQQESQILSNELFGQFANKLFGKRLVIVPDGKLSYFPISALPFPNQNDESKINEPFLLKNEIIYEPSASTLNLLRKISDEPKTSQKDILVFADPVFSEQDERVSSVDKEKEDELAENQTQPFWSNFRSMDSLNSLERLMASQKESETIVQAVGAKNSTLVSGFSANRKQFLESDFSNYKVLHFATHGLLNEERPELSGIVLSQYDEDGNKRDGFIRLQDIYGLNLSADLVVLSACDTGIGKEIKGEGLMSLTNGFLQVGAKSVVSSRWKVDDDATFELMKDFYQELTDNEITPSEALRKAQIKMWKNPRYKSPFYWAAFTIQGDYQNTPKFSRGFNYSIYLLLIISVFALFGLYRGHKFLKKKN